MLKVKHDKSYLYLYDDLNSIFSFEEVKKVCFEGKHTEEKYIKEILDYLENNYKMYQYKKDNGVKFGEEDLFYWSNGCPSYFDVTLQGDNKRLLNEILEFMNSNYSNSDIHVRLQYTRSINWDLVHEYLKNDLNDLNHNEIGILYDLYNNHSKYRDNFTEVEIKRLNDITNNFIEQYDHKKILLSNGIKGTVKYICYLNKYGLFKPRVKNKFIPLSFTNLQGLEVIKNFK